MTVSRIVFLVDVDNTLLDNDRIQSDLKRHLEREFGAASRDRYWAILEQLRILTAVKKIWRDRVTTIFPRQGQYAQETNVVAACPPADLTLERIGDLLDHDLAALLAGQQSVQISQEVAR